MSSMNYRHKTKKKKKGYFYTPDHIFDVDGLSLYSKIIFCYLCRWTNRETTTCFPSIQMIATSCGMCKNTARKALKELEAKHLIKIESTYSENNRQRRNTYMLLFGNIFS